MCLAHRWIKITILWIFLNCLIYKTITIKLICSLIVNLTAHKQSRCLLKWYLLDLEIICSKNPEVIYIFWFLKLCIIKINGLSLKMKNFNHPHYSLIIRNIITIRHGPKSLYQMQKGVPWKQCVQINDCLSVLICYLCFCTNNLFALHHCQHLILGYFIFFTLINLLLQMIKDYAVATSMNFYA